jgi:hypothetical protein
MSFDQMSFDQMSFDQMSFDQMSFDQMSFDQMSFDQMPFFKCCYIFIMQWSQLSFDQMSLDQMSSTKYCCSIFYVHLVMVTDVTVAYFSCSSLSLKIEFFTIIIPKRDRNRNTKRNRKL